MILESQPYLSATFRDGMCAGIRMKSAFVSATKPRDIFKYNFGQRAFERLLVRIPPFEQSLLNLVEPLAHLTALIVPSHSKR